MAGFLLSALFQAALNFIFLIPTSTSVSVFKSCKFPDQTFLIDVTEVVKNSSSLGNSLMCYTDSSEIYFISGYLHTSRKSLQYGDGNIEDCPNLEFFSNTTSSTGPTYRCMSTDPITASVPYFKSRRPSYGEVTKVVPWNTSLSSQRSNWKFYTLEFMVSGPAICTCVTVTYFRKHSRENCNRKMSQQCRNYANAQSCKPYIRFQGHKPLTQAPRQKTFHMKKASFGYSETQANAVIVEKQDKPIVSTTFKIVYGLILILVFFSGLVNRTPEGIEQPPPRRRAICRPRPVPDTQLTSAHVPQERRHQDSIHSVATSQVLQNPEVQRSALESASSALLSTPQPVRSVAASTSETLIEPSAPPTYDDATNASTLPLEGPPPTYQEAVAPSVE